MEVISQRKYYTHIRGYALNHNSSDIEKPFQLELFAPIGTEIYYTLDGSTPNENAIKYTEPILIGDATEKDNIYSMRTDVSAYIPFAELVDIAQEVERLQKEEKRLQGELARVNGMLNNEKFLSKAPEAKIQEEKEKLAKYTQMMEQVKQRLQQLG